VLFLAADFALAGVITWLINHLALRRFCRSEGQHWTERARELYPARSGAVSNLWVVPAVLVLGQNYFYSEAAPHWLVAAVVAGLGTIAASRFFDKVVAPQVGWREWLNLALAGTALRLFWFLIFMGVGLAMPIDFSWQAFALAGGLAIVYGLWAARGGVFTLTLLGLRAPATESLQNLVNQVAARMGIQVKRVLIMKTHLFQAYALPYTNELLFSEPLLRVCTESETEAIVIHEMGHLTESGLVRSLRLLRVLLIIGWVFVKPAHHTFGLMGIPAIILLPILLSIPLSRLSRRLEARADSLAHKDHAAGAALASALCKIYEGNLTPAVLPKQRLRTHPDLYDRMLTAGVQPAFPRPSAPSQRTFSSLVFSTAFGFLLVGAFVKFDHFGSIGAMYNKTSDSDDEDTSESEAVEPTAPATVETSSPTNAEKVQVEDRSNRSR
jgi:Zn-dependent protease with chaperone function